MRHRVSGKQLSRTTSHRRALRRNLAASLIQHGAIRTTEAKAKELRRFVERLITVAREGTLHARRQAAAMLQDRDMIDDEGKLLDKTVLQKLCDEVAPRYVSRDGGYTRIVRLSDRRIGDGGVQVLLQLVEQPSRQTGGKGEEKK
jgi:large subunit ribosomal protein L17